jgi:hypothetical protein
MTIVGRAFRPAAQGGGRQTTAFVLYAAAVRQAHTVTLFERMRIIADAFKRDPNARAEIWFRGTFLRLRLLPNLYPGEVLKMRGTLAAAKGPGRWRANGC